jgi:molybdopterin-guanine dinucleotide biosynthesis protein A
VSEVVFGDVHAFTNINTQHELLQHEQVKLDQAQKQPE